MSDPSALDVAHQRSCGRCGWAITSRSAPRADDAKRKHSCDWQLAKAAARERGASRRDVDRTPQPCRHKQVTHQHGTSACYTLDKCRCPPCSRACSQHNGQRRRAQAYGRYDRYVDAEPVRDHITALRRAGMGPKRITEVSGLSQGLLWQLMYGKRRLDGTQTPSRRVLRTTADRVFAVELDLADGAVVDASDSTRRIQELIACGWSMAKIADRLGVRPSNFRCLTHGTPGVTVGTAKAVEALHRELVDAPPPETTRRERQSVTRARNVARSHGWSPPPRTGGSTEDRQTPLGAPAVGQLERRTDQHTVPDRQSQQRRPRLRVDPRRLQGPASDGGRPTSASGTERRRSEWVLEAACLGHDPELWFCGHEGNGQAPEAKQAKAICRGCPVIEHCFKEALDEDNRVYAYGIWAGLTPRERREAVNSRVRSAETPDMAAMAVAYLEGQTAVQLAAAHGFSPSTINIWLKQHGVPLRKPGNRPLDRASARDSREVA